MKRLRTSELRPGMVVYEDVYSFTNQLILPKGTVLTDKSITSLEFYSVLGVRIDDSQEALEAAEQPKFASLPENLSYSQRIKQTKQFREFEQSFLNNSEALKGSLRDIVNSNAPVDANQMLQSVTDLISKGTTSISVFDMLHNMRQYDDLTYIHSMSVSLICAMFGKWLGLKDEDIKVLTLAGLLHDIGKLMIPDKIIKKPDRLSASEYNIIKTHTLQGYNILKNQNIDDRVKEAALLHHERCDGKGYPLGYGADKLPDFSKIVAIADVYDAMTATRVYRGPMCPFKVISIFESEGFQKYDSRYILIFLDHIAQTYMNNKVILNNGVQGEIVMLNKNMLSKPMIKTDSGFINLVDHKELYIDNLI